LKRGAKFTILNLYSLVNLTRPQVRPARVFISARLAFGRA